MITMMEVEAKSLKIHVPHGSVAVIADERLRGHEAWLMGFNAQEGGVRLAWLGEPSIALVVDLLHKAQAERNLDTFRIFMHPSAVEVLTEEAKGLVQTA